MYKKVVKSLLDANIIRVIENALKNNKRVEIGVEYKDRANKKEPQIVVVEVSRKVNTMSVIKE